MSKIAILFLAHDDVIAIPKAWNRWRGKWTNQVVFYAMSNKAYEGFKTLKPLAGTAWCDPSLFHAYILGLKQILADDSKKELAMIYLASGTDAPARPVEFLLALPHKTKVCPGGKASIKLDGKIRTVDLMHQWFAIRRDDAEKFVNAKQSKFLPLMQLYRASIERISEEIFEMANKQWLTNLEILRARYREEEKDKSAYLNTLDFYHHLVSERLKRKVLEVPSICPDEYWPLELMKELKITPDEDCTTGTWKPIKDEEKFGPLPSPVTWRSPKDVYALKSNDPDSRNVSFEDALKHLLKRWPHMVFFRKFHPTFPEEYDMWKIKS